MTTVSTSDGGARAPSRGLTTSLWVAQVLLATAFAMAGMMKATSPMDQLVEQMAWSGVLPPALVRFIGGAELAAAFGLVLPAITQIKPILTPLAALGLLIVMVLAASFHVARGELDALPINFALGVLSAFVAWGRFKKAPIPPR